MTTDYKFTILIRCSYCRIHMGYKPCGYDPKDAKTDGICPVCYKRVMGELDKRIEAKKRVDEWNAEQDKKFNKLTKEKL